MIAPSAAFARHETIVMHLHCGLARRCGASVFSLLPHELRALAEKNIGINPSKAADVFDALTMVEMIVDASWDGLRD